MLHDYVSLRIHDDACKRQRQASSFRILNFLLQVIVPGFSCPVGLKSKIPISGSSFFQRLRKDNPVSCGDFLLFQSFFRNRIATRSFSWYHFSVKHIESDYLPWGLKFHRLSFWRGICISIRKNLYLISHEKRIFLSFVQPEHSQFYVVRYPSNWRMLKNHCHN